jgi:hypothetical protein
MDITSFVKLLAQPQQFSVQQGKKAVMTSWDPFYHFFGFAVNEQLAEQVAA